MEEEEEGCDVFSHRSDFLIFSVHQFTSLVRKGRKNVNNIIIEYLSYFDMIKIVINSENDNAGVSRQ